MYRRHHIFEMFARGVKVLQEKFPEVTIHTIVAGSEGRSSRDLVKKYGFQYCEMPNRPLSKKMQSTADIAREHNPDYVLCMGSDDILHPDTFARYIELMKQGYDYIGCKDWYFIDYEGNDELYWGGYIEHHNRGVLCGAGRCLSRSLMNQLNWLLWEGFDKALDTSMETRLRGLTYTKAVINLRKEGLYAVDIKTGENMTPFAVWRNTLLLEDGEIKKIFDYVWN